MKRCESSVTVHEITVGRGIAGYGDAIASVFDERSQYKRSRKGKDRIDIG